MTIEYDILEAFPATEIDLPEHMRILTDLKEEYSLISTDASEILKSIKADDYESEEIRVYLYNKIKEHLKSCQRCPLFSALGHTQKVAGEGALNSPLILIGEGPGFDEDKMGHPFVGRAGKLLSTILEKMEIRREKLYITNVIKCRPPQNRTPSQKEIRSCSHNLELELSFVMPKVIIALGAISLNYFKPGSSIIKERGQWIKFEDYWIMPTFHPAYILRQRGKALNKVKWDVWQDFNKAVAKAKEICPDYKYN